MSSTASSAPTEEPIETLQETVSASRLNCFLQCRLKFFFRYVLQIVKPPTPSLHLGSVVHLVLKAWNMARWKKQPFAAGQFKVLFDKGWGLVRASNTQPILVLRFEAATLELLTAYKSEVDAVVAEAAKAEGL